MNRQSTESDLAVPADSLVPLTSAPHELSSATGGQGRAFGNTSAESKADNRQTRVCWLALGALVATYLVWSVLRSKWLEQGNIGIGGLPTLPSLVTAALFLIPVAFVARDPVRGLWLLAATSTLNIFPKVPLFPQVIEVGHLVILLTAVSAVAGGHLLWSTPRHRMKFGAAPDLIAVLFFLFVAEAVLALAIRLYLGGGVWEAKVGMSYVLHYGCLLALVLLVCSPRAPVEEHWRAMIEGTLAGIVIAIALGLIGIAALFLSEIQHAADTGLGFAYSERLKSTFSNPSQAGHFYVLSIPFMLYFGSRHCRVRRHQLLAAAAIVLLTLLIVATGSRMARLELALVLACGLAVRSFRRVELLALPLAVPILAFGFTFISLPGMVSYYFGDGALAYHDVSQHFWQDQHRARLLSGLAERMEAAGAAPDTLAGTESLFGVLRETFPTAPLDPTPAGPAAGVLPTVLTWIFGLGPGLAGYDSSSYPSPHVMVLDIWVEQGLFGVGIVLAIAAIIVVQTAKGARSHDPAVADLSITLLFAIAVLGASGLAYANQTWSFFWHVLLMAIIVSRWAALPANATTVRPIAEV